MSKQSYLEDSFIPFKNSRDRIGRAEAYSVTLAERWNSLSETELYDGLLYIEPDGTGSFRIRPLEGAIPNDLPLIFGEMTYQLRAALDNAIYDAAILSTGKIPPPKHGALEFPIFTDPDDFTNRAYKIAPLTDKRRAIVESVQPYNAPKDLPAKLVVFNFNRAIGILHDWARADRHRKVNVVGAWAINASPQFRLPEGVKLRNLKIKAWGFLEHEDEIATFTLDGYNPSMKVQANPQLLFDIAVDEGPPRCHESDSFGIRMTAIIRAVRTIVDLLEHG